jgi:hypothetical protein
MQAWCLSETEPWLWRLLDIMNIYRVKLLCIRVRNITALKDDYSQLSGRPPHYSLEEATKLLIGQIDDAIADCRVIGLPDTIDTLNRVKGVAQTGKLDAPRLEREAMRAHDALLDGFNKIGWVFVPIHLTKYLHQKALFGDEVAKRFPNAVDDIRAAGNCLAVGCDTAAVFHLMRVVEHGLRAFAKHLGVRRMIHQKRSSLGIVIGKRYTPVAYETWDKILNSLPKRVEKRLNRLRPGPTKQQWQGFYSTVLIDINAIREAWRNHVMHTRQDVTPLEAEGIKVRVEGIMHTLAKRLREV